jgi:hypothetical protein
MNCDRVRIELALYLYGELAGAEEEAIEGHLEGCAACAKELEVRKAMMKALDQAQAEPAASLLAACRTDLLAAVGRETAPARVSWIQNLGEGMRGLLTAWSGWRTPVAAVALIALGFFSARFTAPGVVPAGGVERAREAPVVVSAVRSVEHAPDGGVRIALDETRRRTVSGAVSDARIQALLLSAIREEEDARVRVESMELLKAQSAASPAVREALIGALIHDPNEAVRLKAFDGLRQTVSDAATRKAMLYALTADQNFGLREQAIDMLTERQDRELVGVWQVLVEREQDPSIRERYQKALRAMNASVGTF